MAVQLAVEALNTCSKTVGLESFWTTYWLYSFYESKSNLLNSINSRSDGHLLRFQCELLYGVKNSVTTEEKADKDPRGHSRVGGQARRLLTLRFFSHLRAPSGSSSLYKLHSDNI